MSEINTTQPYNHQITPDKITIRYVLRQRRIEENGILVTINGKIVYNLDEVVNPSDDLRVLYSLKERS